MYREGTMRSMCHEWDPNIFPPGLTNSVNRHFIIWLTFEKFKKFVLTWTGHDRLACMGKPKKIFYKKNFPLFCCVRTRNSQFVEKHVLVSHFCSLLSLIFCNKSEQCSLFLQQSHTNKCIMARQLVADQLMSTCPPYTCQHSLWFSKGLCEQSQSYDETPHLLPFTPKIWLLILLSGHQILFPCKLVTRIWSRQQLLPDKFHYSHYLFAG